MSTRTIIWIKDIFTFYYKMMHKGMTYFNKSNKKRYFFSFLLSIHRNNGINLFPESSDYWLFIYS
jgi:hypothetical protein